MARVSYLDPVDLPSEYQDLTESAVSLESSTPKYEYLLKETTRNAYRAQAHLPEGLEAYQDMYSRVTNNSELTEFEQNLIALGTARLIDSKYEWHNMVRIAINTDMSKETIKSIADYDLSVLDDKHAALLQYVRQFVEGSVDDDIHEQVETYYDDQTITSIAMLTGYWVANGLVIHALDVETEESFFGWDLADL